MSSYITVSGDTWDIIAYNLYGDVKFTEQLMAANQNEKLLATVVFDSGVTLALPEIDSTEQPDDSLPPWRTS